MVYEGDIGGLSTPATPQKKSIKHRITAKKRSETLTSQFKVLSYD